jgi:hypothetical protein
MPKTKFQDFIFTIIMVFVMVYCMTLYNISLELGFTYATFGKALLGMWVEAVAAFFAQRYIAGPMAKKLTGRILQPGVDKPVFILVAMACFTVCFMAPIMTLFVTIYHHGFVKEIIPYWLPKLVLNFPFALVIQIFFAGPLVRFLFRTLFRGQLQNNAEVSQTKIARGA